MFCTDLLFEMNSDLDGSDAWDVAVAVLNKVFKGEEPEFSKKYLYRYYEDLLFTTQSAYNKYKSDGRSKTSAENGKKGGRPPKSSPIDEHNEQVRKIQREKQKRRIYEQICEEPFKFCDGASWYDITRYFDWIEPSPDLLRTALKSLHKDGLIYFNNEGSKVIIKQVGVASLKKSE